MNEKEYLEKREKYAFEYFLKYVFVNPNSISKSSAEFAYKVADMFLSAGREDRKELTEQEKIWIKKYKETYGTNKNQ